MIISNLLNDDTAKYIVDYIRSEKDRIDTNEKLFDIYENSIGDLLDERLLNDLGNETFNQAKYRKFPVNIIKHVIDKLSKIYQQEPRREVVGGNAADEKILAYFEDILNIDHNLNINNETGNLFLNSLLQIGNDNGYPFIRTIPNHKFLVINNSEIDPTSDDIVVLFMSPEKDALGTLVDIYWVYSDEQFAVYDGTGKVRFDLMSMLGQDGTNNVGAKPFMYYNASSNLVMPKVQSDTLDIALLIPLLLTDVNYIAKFCAYSILYGIDVDDKNMKMSPNVFWNFKSDDESDKKPEIGSIKPEGDIEKLINSAMSQLSIWLNSKGLKSSGVGDADVRNVASGIAKLIDEADVSDIRKFQASMYRQYEQRFWDLLLKKIYPFWRDQGLVENIGDFSIGARVSVNFKEQTPMQDRSSQVASLKLEHESGFTTKRRVLMELNPQMTENEIDIMLKEIDDEETVTVAVIDRGVNVQE